MAVYDESEACVRAPINDYQAAAGFIGLKPTTSKHHMVRAILESLVFRVVQLYDTLQQEAGCDCSLIRLLPSSFFFVVLLVFPFVQFLGGFHFGMAGAQLRLISKPLGCEPGGFFTSVPETEQNLGDYLVPMTVFFTLETQVECLLVLLQDCEKVILEYEVESVEDICTIEDGSLLRLLRDPVDMFPLGLSK
uniref:Carbohydrate kinase FGGY C-terminal domain-containing protein n=1 Tax=Timema monikensis TaxID=170555 RepID=A0A7R9HJY2_9NEOP|nr:unnamed protein product [Timema monikensis]